MAKKRTKRRMPGTKMAAAKSTDVRRAIKEIRDYYQLGLNVLEADRENPNRQTYSKGVSMKIAAKIGKSRDYVDKARQFASKYTEEQLEELCSLRRPDGLPIGRRHLVALLSIKDKRHRKRLQRKAADEGWGTRRLGEDITALQGSRSSGGRRPRGPASRFLMARWATSAAKLSSFISKSWAARIRVEGISSAVRRTLQSHIQASHILDGREPLAF